MKLKHPAQNRYLKLVFLSGILLVFAASQSCIKTDAVLEPRDVQPACFTVNSDSAGALNYQFHFKPCRVASQHFWEFDDGNTSTAPSPYHTYNEYGTYYVRYTAVIDGIPTTTTKEVTYGVYKVLNFNGSILVEEPIPAECYDTEYYLAIEHDPFVDNICEWNYQNEMLECGSQWYTDIKTAEPTIVLLARHKCGWGDEFINIAYEGDRELNLNESMRYIRTFTSENGSVIEVTLEFSVEVPN